MPKYRVAVEVLIIEDFDVNESRSDYATKRALELAHEKYGLTDMCVCDIVKMDDEDELGWAGEY